MPFWLVLDYDCAVITTYNLKAVAKEALSAVAKEALKAVAKGTTTNLFIVYPIRIARPARENPYLTRAHCGG